jgi:uncharacterized protein with HEPN domain
MKSSSNAARLAGVPYEIGHSANFRSQVTKGYFILNFKHVKSILRYFLPGVQQTVLFVIDIMHELHG